ncbi:hypothetical protein T03_12074 [Trichinella britovi]|uniref:Uncharacterized protein n=1 Tax=Trichinella britovi TaxID=45882 RepID=A0A0V1C6P8_TRIBR|nr:hypothetical protein T03_12074 [Trichinella britovi]
MKQVCLKKVAIKVKDILLAKMFNNQVLFLFKAIDEHLKWLISEAGSKYFAMDMLYHSNKRIGSDSVHRCCNHFQWFLRCWSCYKQM